MCTETLFENAGNNTVCLTNAGAEPFTLPLSGRNYKPGSGILIAGRKIIIPLLDI
jgi:hypothetical protein